MADNKLREINIKNCAYYYDDIISINDFSSKIIYYVIIYYLQLYLLQCI